MRGLTVLAMGAVLLGGSAQAASFDCTRAKSLRERAVCANPALSAADEAMARGYAAAQAAASEAYRSELRDMQLAWLRHVDLICTSGHTDPAEAFVQECLSSELRNRTQFFDHAVTKIGPYLFTQSWRVTDVPDPAQKAADYWRFGVKSLQWPQLVGNDAKTAAFNAWLRKSFGIDDKDGEGAEVDTDLTIGVERATPDFIALAWSYFLYSHGAAHPNHASQISVWLTGPGRALEASDVFAGAGWAEKLADLVDAEFPKANQGQKQWADRKDLLKMVVQPTRWHITPASFSLLFQPYELAPYAAGEIELALKWSDIAPLLAPGSAVVAALRQ